jgi:hypothetical protein
MAANILLENRKQQVERRKMHPIEWQSLVKMC